DEVRRRIIEAKTPSEVLALFMDEEQDLPQI
ncbi:MAG TPA: PTS sugar transporter subunit IIA, partial [Chlorobaculum parvum]|nr:PTS sugar transporter subunit IIA [Chlorobaculum parvum]